MSYRGKKHNVINSAFYDYSFLFMLTCLVDSATIVIDSMFSKSLGTNALAAQGMCTPSFVLCAILANMLTTGIRSRCSASMSMGNTKEIRKYFSTGCFFIVVLAVITTVGCFVFLNTLVRLFGADGSDPVLQENLRDILRGWFPGIPGFFGFFFLQSMVTLDGDKKCIRIASFVMFAENIIMDWLSITLMKNGMWGIGFSTGLSYICGCVILLSHFIRRKDSFRFSVHDVRPAILPEVLRIGAPKLTHYGSKFIAPLIINNVVIAVGGSAVMAAYSMQCSLISLCAVPNFGLTHSVSLFSEVYYSQKDKDALKKIYNSTLKLSMMTCIPVSVAVIVFSMPIASFYLKSNPDAHQYGVMALVCMALAILPNALNLAIISYLQGARKLVACHIQTISLRLFMNTVTTGILGYTMGVRGLFFAIPIAELLVMVSYLLGVALFFRRKSLVETILMLPEDFYISENNQLNVTVTNLNESINISDKIGTFCRSHNIDHRRSMFASLCAEELVTNVVNHGFKMDTHSHSCDVWVAIEDGDVILHIRDDCRRFNPVERYEKIRAVEEDISANVGIRLVYKIAKDIRYVNLLETNTLIVRV